MRVERLLKMLFFRYGLRFIQKGADRMARPKGEDGKPLSNREMTPEQRKQFERTRKTTRGATQAARMARRFGKF